MVMRYKPRRTGGPVQSGIFDDAHRKTGPTGRLPKRRAAGWENVWSIERAKLDFLPVCELSGQLSGKAKT
jgi:hypothetical protein